MCIGPGEWASIESGKRRVLKLCVGLPIFCTMKLIRLIYASAARTEMSYAELTNILRTAEAHNGQQGITGILCYGGGMFLQALEGERAVVNALYNRIIADPRHDQCEILRYGRIATRRYDQWKMKFVGIDDPATAHRRDLVLRHSGTADFTPLRMTGGQASALLYDLSHEFRIAA